MSIYLLVCLGSISLAAAVFFLFACSVARLSANIQPVREDEGEYE